MKFKGFSSEIMEKRAIKKYKDEQKKKEKEDKKNLRIMKKEEKRLRKEFLPNEAKKEKLIIRENEKINRLEKERLERIKLNENNILTELENKTLTPSLSLEEKTNEENSEGVECKKCGKFFIQVGHKKRLCKKCYNEKQKEIQRNRSSTPEGYFKQLLHSINNGKKRRDSSLKIEDLIDIYKKQDGKCALSGIQMTLGDKRDGNRNPFSMSIDRIDNSEGYTKDNVWLVIKAVNTFKSCYDLGIVFKIVKSIAEENSFSFSRDE